MKLHVCQSFFLSLFNFLHNSSLRSFYFLVVSLSGKQRHLFIILWRFKNLDWRSHRVKYLPRFGFWSSCKLSSVLLRCGEIVVRLAPCCLALALEWSCWHVMAQKHLFEIRVSSIVTLVIRWTASSVSVYINERSVCNWCVFPLLDAFAKWRKATTHVVGSLRPSAWNNWASIGQILIKFDIWVFFRKSFDQIQVWLKYISNNGHFYMKTIVHPWQYRRVLLRMRNVSDKSCRRNRNTHFVYNNFVPDYCAVYEIMPKNTVDPERPHMTI